MNIVKTIFRYFFSGVLALLPFAVTIAIVLWCSQLFITYFGPNTVVGRVLSYMGIKLSHEGMAAYFFGWVIVLLALFATGFFIDVLTKKMAIRWFDRLIKCIPIIGPIYGTARQFTDLMNKDGNNEIKNMSPVYCRFGSMPGTLFLALLPTSEEMIIAEKSYKLVIIPTAPVPFGGAMVYVPSEDVFDADMSIENLISLYVSMGVSMPKSNNNKLESP